MAWGARRTQPGQPPTLPPSVAGGDVDGRLQHVGQRGASRRQRLDEIGHDLLRLAPDIAIPDHRLVLIERARVGGENQRSRPRDRGVCIGNGAFTGVVPLRRLEA